MGTAESNKLDALRQRELDLRAKIAEEVKRQQKRRWRDLDRLRTIIGGRWLPSPRQTRISS
jgi:hypothetical protein